MPWMVACAVRIATLLPAITSVALALLTLLRLGLWLSLRLWLCSRFTRRSRWCRFSRNRCLWCRNLAGPVRRDLRWLLDGRFHHRLSGLRFRLCDGGRLNGRNGIFWCFSCSFSWLFGHGGGLRSALAWSARARLRGCRLWLLAHGFGTLLLGLHYSPYCYQRADAARTRPGSARTIKTLGIVSDR
jgi:hypothetical protein